MVILCSGGGTRTWDEYILVWGTDELHCLLREDGHVLVRGIAGDVLVGAVVERNEDVEEN